MNDEDFEKLSMETDKLKVVSEKITRKFNKLRNEPKVDSKEKECVDRDDVFDTFHFDLERDQTVPIFRHRERIISKIRACPVTILTGETGCGKTTQVPQYILDDCYSRNEYCNIVVTQPRRIAARSIAQRVADERKWEVGTLVGYQVGLNAMVSEYTRLLYATTGVLLQRLITNKTLHPFTHVIIDEVHERDQDIDFLLIVVRRLMATTSFNTKLIIMSATIETQEFANYFQIRKVPAPVIGLQIKKKFNVEKLYLDDLAFAASENLNDYYMMSNISREMYRIATKLIVEIDQKERLNAENETKNSILVFLPGIQEISTMFKYLANIPRDFVNQKNPTKLMPIRLHSLISTDEQMRIFECQAPGYRKVILATNIAESSITVPDVKYVIDFCLTKILMTDSATNYSSLQLTWAAKSNCRQRAGRAGRVMNGYVFRLVHRSFYKEVLMKHGIPEMQRSPLSNLVLRAKLLNMGTPGQVLKMALSPPKLQNIRSTILNLKEIGAFYIRLSDGSYNKDDGEISYLGRIMANLPIDIHLSRLVVFGSLFGVLEETIIIAAGLTVRSIFKIISDRFQRDTDIYIEKLRWAAGTGSDLLALLNAYRTWVNMREQHNLDDAAEVNWTNRRCLNLRQLKEMHVMVKEIKQRLIPFNMKVYNSGNHVQWLDREKVIILKIVIAGAFYPNYLTRSKLSHVISAANIYHDMYALDPCRTVYFTRFNAQLNGQLYVQSIKEYFKRVYINAQNIKVCFPENSERIFVSFEPDAYEQELGSNCVFVPGSVCTDVYKALSLRQCGISLVLSVMDPNSCVRYLKQHNLGVFDAKGKWRPKVIKDEFLESAAKPGLLNIKLRGKITHVIHCGKFYFQTEQEEKLLSSISAALNSFSAVSCFFESAHEISKGMIVAALLNDAYERAQILNAISSGRKQIEFRVLFIDFGITAQVPYENLRKLTPNAARLAKLGPRCFECRLALIEPSYVKSPDASESKWCFEANDILTRLADEQDIEIEVYSYVAGVTNILVQENNSTVNQRLVDLGLARTSEESFMSMMDHDMRVRSKLAASRNSSEDNQKLIENYQSSLMGENYEELPAPSRDLCNEQILLKGPYSPLETKYQSPMPGMCTLVKNQRDSVNSIVLDTDPHDIHERLLVAAEISGASELTAQWTTLMPNIRGFGALMVMLFCPRLQMNGNNNNTKYASILAGLGCDAETQVSLFPQHDIVFNLDVEFSQKDFEQINELRTVLDTLLFTSVGEDHPSINPAQYSQLQNKMKSLIIKLLNKDRQLIETFNNASHRLWRVDSIENDTRNLRSIFPKHTVLPLNSENIEGVAELHENCRQLYVLKDIDYMESAKCLLCNVEVEKKTELRVHLLSQLHRHREKEINFQMNRM